MGARAFAQDFSIHHAGIDGEVVRDFDDDQLVEVAASLDPDAFLLSERADGFDFDKIVSQFAVGAGGKRLVSNDSVSHFRVEFSQLSIDQQMSSGGLVVESGVVKQPFDHPSQFQRL